MRATRGAGRDDLQLFRGRHGADDDGRARGDDHLCLQPPASAHRQQSGTVSWVHQDPVTKSQRVTDVNGTVTATKIDLDPWGGETRASAHTSTQPQRYTTYTRDQNGGDDAQMRRYSGAQQRFSQPDPYDGSYSLADPQSFNRYSYVQNDPVNFVDPSGLDGFIYWFDSNGQFHGLHLVNGGTANSGSGRVGGGGIGGSGGSGLFGSIEIAFAQNADGAGGGVPQQTTPSDTLRKNMEDLLAKPECRHFVDKLLGYAFSVTGNLPVSNNVLDMFDMVRSQSGVTFGAFSLQGTAVSYAHGSLGENDARLEISNIYGPNSRVQGLIGIHETLHVAGRYGAYDDRVFAEAIYKMRVAEGRKPIPLPDRNNFKNINEWVLANSQYWHSFLTGACK
jgi:RHS repeat-associated protein